MDERVLNEEYINILLDGTFVKTVIVRTVDGMAGNHRIDLIRAYKIPVPEINPDYPWSPSEVLKIVCKLKNIERNVNWNKTMFDGYTSEAISFMSLLEAVAGKRNLCKLAYLVFNEMYI